MKFGPRLDNEYEATAMNRYLLVVATCLLLTSCEKPSGPAASTSTEPQPKLPHFIVTAQGVRLVAVKIEAGKASSKQLQEGLQSAAEVLSSILAEARKSWPQLKGNLRGTFRVEPDGTPRMFMEKGSEFTPPEGSKVSDDFIAATFGGKWKFPQLGSDLMLTVDFMIETNQ